MKMMKYFLFALIGAGLFACSNDDDGLGTDPEVDSKSKTVTLSIKSPLNVGLKSVSKPTTDTKIKLSKAYILFYTKQGEVWDVKVVNTKDDIADLVSDDGLTFHEISDAVENIAVIGNPRTYDAKAQSWQPSIAIPKKGDLISDIEKETISAFDQQDQDYITLYGKGALGNPVKKEEHGDAVKYDTYVYQPEITVKALVSRFEIGNIQCEDLGGLYGKILIYGIGLVDFYEYTTLAGTASSKLLEGIYKADKDEGVIEKSGHIFETNLKNPGTIDPFFNFEDQKDRIKWRFTSGFENGANEYLDDKDEKFNPPTHYGQDPRTGVFAFNFIPKAGEFPAIKLQTAILSKDNPSSGIGVYWYVTTSGFDVDNTVQHPAPGYIYTLDFKFKEENLGDYNHDIRCADVIVKVTSWELEVVDPEFK